MYSKDLENHRTHPYLEESDRLFGVWRPSLVKRRVCNKSCLDFKNLCQHNPSFDLQIISLSLFKREIRVSSFIYWSGTP